MQTTDLNEQFYELVERYNRFIEPLENWSTDDLISLQMVLYAELQERDRIAQNEYFNSYGGTSD